MAHEVPGHRSLIMEDLQQAMELLHPPQSPIHLEQLICSIIHSLSGLVVSAAPSLGANFKFGKQLELINDQIINIPFEDKGVENNEKT
jgi:hypothetical protein